MIGWHIATANKAANTIICSDTIDFALENYFTLSTFCNLRLAFSLFERVVSNFFIFVWEKVLQNILTNLNILKRLILDFLPESSDSSWILCLLAKMCEYLYYKNGTELRTLSLTLILIFIKLYQWMIVVSTIVIWYKFMTYTMNGI